MEIERHNQNLSTHRKDILELCRASARFKERQTRTTPVRAAMFTIEGEQRCFANYPSSFRLRSCLAPLRWLRRRPNPAATAFPIKHVPITPMLWLRRTPKAPPAVPRWRATPTVTPMAARHGAYTRPDSGFPLPVLLDAMSNRPQATSVPRAVARTGVRRSI
jgi:hypothetical protein